MCKSGHRKRFKAMVKAVLAYLMTKSETGINT